MQQILFFRVLSLSQQLQDRENSMKKIALFLSAFLVIGIGTASAQMSANPGQEPILAEMVKISRSVQTLNDRLKSFVDKFEKVGGLTFTEKQQELIFGLELLVRAEALVAGHQKTLVELTEKLNETRGKIAQVDVDIRPRSIDRSLSLVGTTETEELRDNKRQKLQAERQSLVQLFAQIQDHQAENNEKLRSAQALATALRKQYLPQIEKEIYKQ
jgi:hypothetical protein